MFLSLLGSCRVHIQQWCFAHSTYLSHSCAMNYKHCYPTCTGSAVILTPLGQ
jgi:hypothetical protein